MKLEIQTFLVAEGYLPAYEAPVVVARGPTDVWECKKCQKTFSFAQLIGERDGEF
jgi:hypothetical protein